jgi:adenylate cyclase
MTTQVDKTRPREIKRKLTAILSADVKGYSRLMGEDEEWTLRTLNTYKEVMRSLIQQHRGRVVSTEGDRVLAEFASVVDAVQCSVEIQQVLRAKNAVLPENRRMEFRIGINLGDVIEEGDSIYGDGVNIAARLEGLAEVGGICISGSAYEQIENKLPLRYDYLGEHEVKNIAKPVRVYRARIEPEAVPPKLGEEKKIRPRQWQRATIGLVVAVIVVVAAVVIWKLYTPSTPQPEVISKEKVVVSQPEKVPATAPPSAELKPKEKVTPPPLEKVPKTVTPLPLKEEVASKEKMALPLPDKPSIAVLPFVNMSEDPKQEFLCDGMTEEIITVLSKVPGLFVIARNSTFAYKGKPVKFKQVSEELGVRYVLEGSFQRSGDRVRITAQMIDALTGHHLWAEQYERDLKEIFALQDEITLKILMATQVKLTEGELSLGYGKYYGGEKGLDCYLKIMQGNDLVYRRNIKDNNLARGIAEEALAMCPEVPMGYLLMAYVHSTDYWLGTTSSPRESIEKAIELVQKALALDDTLAEAHGLLGYLYNVKREYDKGIAEGERAVALDPGGANVLGYYALSLNFAGRSEEAILLLQKAIRLNPNPVSSFLIYHMQLGQAFMYTGRYEEAVSAYKKAIERRPKYLWSHLMLAATYSMMGREKEAQAEIAEVLSINPKFSLDFYEKTAILKDRSIVNKIVTALRKAGLK